MSRLSENVAKVLVGEVVSGGYPVDELLPKEVDLAARFKASRGTVREAIRTLEDRRLVRVVHGVGAVVEPESRWDPLDRDVLSALLVTSRGPKILGDFLETRRLLEVESAGLAARRGDDDSFEIISSAYQRLKESAYAAARNPLSESEYLEADAAFHSAVLSAAGNLVLSRMVEPLQRALHAVMEPLARPDLRIMRSLPEHERIMKAVLARDEASSRDAMDEHLATSLEYLAALRAERSD